MEASDTTETQAIDYVDNALRIIPASYVTADSGTGLVHCAPAHGVDDYNAFRNSGLLTSCSSPMQNMICHVDGSGKFTSEIIDIVGEDAGRALIGEEVLKGGGKAVVDLLSSMGDALLGVQRIKHRYPYDWKTEEPVIVT